MYRDAAPRLRTDWFRIGTTATTLYDRGVFVSVLRHYNPAIRGSEGLYLHIPFANELQRLLPAGRTYLLTAEPCLVDVGCQGSLCGPQ